MFACNQYIVSTPWTSLQVAHGYLQHVLYVTGGEVDDHGAWIELESLLETYELSLPDVRECELCGSWDMPTYLHAAWFPHLC